MYLHDVLNFNKPRNRLALDMQLEVNMLKEEAQEFFDAETFAEQIDALIDFGYVYDGMRMKVAYNGFTIDENLKLWATETTTLMIEILEERVNSETLAQILIQARDIVCEINAQKAYATDENGKVIKPKDLPDATAVIREMLKEGHGL